MSKPIKISEQIIQDMLSQFEEKIRSLKMSDGDVTYHTSIAHTEEHRTNLVFTPKAYTKMLALVMNYDSEIAWHGVVRRTDTGFSVDDILVYPQEVTGATVTTDQEEYQDWLLSLDDETFNNLRLQGHSHVKMGVSPSSTDLTNWEDFLSKLRDDMFYVLMIFNQKMDKTIRIYDLRDNILYNTNDIDVFVGGAEINLEDFIADAKDMVKKNTYKYTKNAQSSAKSKYSYNYCVDDYTAF